MFQAVTDQSRVRSQSSLCCIRGAQSDTGKVFSSGTSVSPVSIIPRMPLIIFIRMLTTPCKFCS